MDENQTRLGCDYVNSAFLLFFAPFAALRETDLSRCLFSLNSYNKGNKHYKTKVGITHNPIEEKPLQTNTNKRQYGKDNSPQKTQRTRRSNDNY